MESFLSLLREVEIKRTEDCERTFERIKEILSTSPVLLIYDEQKPIFIYTDAGGIGIGATDFGSEATQ